MPEIVSWEVDWEDVARNPDVFEKSMGFEVEHGEVGITVRYTNRNGKLVSSNLYLWHTIRRVGEYY